MMDWFFANAGSSDAIPVVSLYLNMFFPSFLLEEQEHKKDKSEKKMI
jgi:hypothetical protein